MSSLSRPSPATIVPTLLRGHVTIAGTHRRPLVPCPSKCSPQHTCRMAQLSCGPIQQLTSAGNTRCAKVIIVEEVIPIVGLSGQTKNVAGAEKPLLQAAIFVRECLAGSSAAFNTSTASEKKERKIFAQMDLRYPSLLSDVTVQQSSSTHSPTQLFTNGASTRISVLHTHSRPSFRVECQISRCESSFLAQHRSPATDLNLNVSRRRLKRTPMNTRGCACTPKPGSSRKIYLTMGHLGKAKKLEGHTHPHSRHAKCPSCPAPCFSPSLSPRAPAPRKPATTLARRPQRPAPATHPAAPRSRAAAIPSSWRPHREPLR